MSEFFRMGERINCDVTPASQAATIKVDLREIGLGATHFRIVNDCKWPITLKGIFGVGPTFALPSSPALVTDDIGWFFPPGIVEEKRSLITLEKPVIYLSAKIAPSHIWGTPPNNAKGRLMLQYGNMAS